MKVAFLCSLNERGTSVATYDYAHFNETLLRNESTILIGKNRSSTALSRFKRRFRIVSYDSPTELSALIKCESIDVCYMLVHGHRDKSPSMLPSGCKCAVHCVFSTLTPFGDVYATISDYVNRRIGTCYPVVPHMVHLPQINADLRSELGIPKEAIVFGRHGGSDTFNIHFVHKVIEKIVRKRPDIYFLLLNTEPFLASPHPQVVHLPTTYDVEQKAAFIHTCDAMLHARKRRRNLRTCRRRILPAQQTGHHLAPP